MVSNHISKMVNKKGKTHTDSKVLEKKRLRLSKKNSQREQEVAAFKSLEKISNVVCNPKTTRFWWKRSKKLIFKNGKMVRVLSVEGQI